MDVMPIRKYKEPRYPNKKEALRNPVLLKKLPERWKNNVCVGTALSALLMMSLSGCVRKQTFNEREKEASGKLAGAPIFQHGSGRGSFGCDSVAPPAFLSEEEAFQVIQEEAKAYGIVFEKNGKVIEKVEIPETKYYLKSPRGDEDYNKDGKVISTTKLGSLVLDGNDSSKKITFEFVSKEDYDNWHGEDSGWSTVEDFDFLTAAKVLREGLIKKADGSSIGVFYEPMVDYSSDKMKEVMGKANGLAMEVNIKEIKKQDLRAQVKDFLEWLKAQEII